MAGMDRILLRVGRLGSLSLLGLAPIVACASNIQPSIDDAVAPKSGSRLKVVWLVAPDGTRVVHRGTLWDKQLNQYCQYFGYAGMNGDLRCYAARSSVKLSFSTPDSRYVPGVTRRIRPVLMTSEDGLAFEDPTADYDSMVFDNELLGACHPHGTGCRFLFPSRVTVAFSDSKCTAPYLLFQAESATSVGLNPQREYVTTFTNGVCRPETYRVARTLPAGITSFAEGEDGTCGIVRSLPEGTVVRELVAPRPGLTLAERTVHDGNRLEPIRFIAPDGSIAGFKTYYDREQGVPCRVGPGESDKVACHPVAERAFRYEDAECKRPLVLAATCLPAKETVVLLEGPPTGTRAFVRKVLGDFVGRSYGLENGVCLPDESGRPLADGWTYQRTGDVLKEVVPVPLRLEVDP